MKGREDRYDNFGESNPRACAIGGEKSLGNELAEQMKLVATDVTVVVLKNAGHWVLEERPTETTDALVKFL
jgi:pimeloyl-ACP methyl ester carboxylesterase